MPFDHPAGVLLHRRAGDRRREHRLPQHLPRVQGGLAAQLVLGVGEVRHLLQPRPDDHPAHVADGAHHLQFLVDDHRQLLDLLAVGEEVQQVLGRVGALGGVAVRAADRVHDDRASGHPDVHLGARPDQRPLPGVHDERPVRAPLALQEPPEQRQRVGPPEPRDAALVGPPDHEVGALFPPDLLVEDPPDDPRVLLVADVEAAALDPHLVRGQPVQRLGERDVVALLGGEHQQRCAVVADVETALADLPEGDERQPLLGQAGEPVVLRDRADQQLHQVVVVAGGPAAEQGEGAGVGQQAVERCHGSVSFSVRGEERSRPHKRRRPPLGRPSRVLRHAQSVGRRMSGPPPVLAVLDRVREHAADPSASARGPTAVR
ncbi:hypothetical protein SVIOM342S_08897 [Streptomyces violaceorubidus]